MGANVFPLIPLPNPPAIIKRRVIPFNVNFATSSFVIDAATIPVPGFPLGILIGKAFKFDSQGQQSDIGPIQQIQFSYYFNGTFNVDSIGPLIFFVPDSMQVIMIGLMSGLETFQTGQTPGCVVTGSFPIISSGNTVVWCIKAPDSKAGSVVAPGGVLNAMGMNFTQRNFLFGGAGLIPAI